VKLIKDIASAPGAWLKKLGAAVVDGIKNHLWSAFKTAVVDWFKSKVFELLGVGGIILELLLEGGLTREHIIQMALDALMVAIPAALVAILIEKLVAMIIPAAGAVMAIIEGLQAAWGTISRIIAAISAFVGFLLAVKTGSAGPLFAGLLAAAAVILLDFVANWLLKKLMSAARKVGAKLKGLAEKFKAKRKAKKDAKAKKHHDDHDGKNKPHDDTRKSKEDKKKEEIQKRVEKAERELPPKIGALISKRPSKLRVRAQFAIWKITYRLSRLEIIKGGGGVDHIEAQVNPKINLGPAGKAYEFEWSEIAPIFHQVAAKYVGPATHGTDASGAHQYQARGQGADASLEQLGKYATGAHADGSPAGFEVREKEKGFPFWAKGKVAEVRQPGTATGRMYPEVARDLEGVDNQALGRYLKAKMRGEPNLPSLGGREAAANELFGMWSFEPGHPRKRIETPAGTPNQYKPTFGHQRDWTYAMMSADLLENGHVNVQDAIMKHPAQGGGAQPGAKLVTAVDVHHTQHEPTSGPDKELYDKRVKKEIELVETWVRAKCTGPNAKLWETKPTTTQIKDWVEEQIKQFRGH
jgi:Skp family chaperone for outer membrane proteins